MSKLETGSRLLSGRARQSWFDQLCVPYPPLHVVLSPTWEPNGVAGEQVLLAATVWFQCSPTHTLALSTGHHSHNAVPALQICCLYPVHTSAGQSRNQCPSAALAHS